MKRFVLLAKNKGLPAGQWDSQKVDDVEDDVKDYFEEKYEISDDMGIIMYRDFKYLTCLRDICEDEDKKFKTFEKVLSDYANWPVRPSPKEHRIAWEEAQAAKAAAAKSSSDCCAIL
ncbi:hypothetical protein EV175_000284 [Coemansia sp. RSA 1933]|nr:hypothetical protein EV175_000284 [Coemansia sp. RSA 1933]